MLTFNNIQPNCLLTIYPIIFFLYPRLLLPSTQHWYDIPDWLEAHGYDVFVFSFKSIYLKNRIKELQAFLELSKGDAYHFVADKNCREELNWLQQSNSTVIKTLTLGEAPRHSHMNYLSWAISLAENELTC